MSQKYVSDFLCRALRDELDPDVQFELSRIFYNKNMYMPLKLIAEQLRCSTRTLKRKIRKNPDMRAAGSRPVGGQHTILYPFWVIHELYVEDLAEHEGEDEDDSEDDEE